MTSPTTSSARSTPPLSSRGGERRLFRTHTDRTWWLLAPNPFVVLADAAPALPDEDRDDEGLGVQAADLDPLGQIGSVVRQLRVAPDEQGRVGQAGEDSGTVTLGPDELSERPAVWPTGLGINVLLGAGALALTVRRLRTPTRTLPKGQRVA